MSPALRTALRHIDDEDYKAQSAAKSVSFKLPGHCGSHRAHPPGGNLVFPWRSLAVARTAQFDAAGACQFGTLWPTKRVLPHPELMSVTPCSKQVVSEKIILTATRCVEQPPEPSSDARVCSTKSVSSYVVSIFQDRTCQFCTAIDTAFPDIRIFVQVLQ